MRGNKMVDQDKPLMAPSLHRSARLAMALAVAAALSGCSTFNGTSESSHATVLHDDCDFHYPDGKIVSCETALEAARTSRSMDATTICVADLTLEDVTFRVLHSLATNSKWIEVQGLDYAASGILHTGSGPENKLLGWEQDAQSGLFVYLPADWRTVVVRLYTMDVHATGNWQGAKVRPLWTLYGGEPWLVYEVEAEDATSYAMNMEEIRTGNGALYVERDLVYEGRDGTLQADYEHFGDVSISFGSTPVPNCQSGPMGSGLQPRPTDVRNALNPWENPG